MFEDLPTALVENLTPWGIVLLVVFLIVTGKLIPQFYYKELKEDRNRWRATAESMTRSLNVFSKGFPELLEVGKTTTKVMTDIREKSESTEDVT